MRVRRIWPVALLLLAPALAACSDDGGGGDSGAADDESSSATPSESPTEASTSASVEPSTSATAADPSSSAAPGVLPAACDIVTSDDVSQAYHVALGPASVGGGSTSEQGVEWQSDNCGFEAEDVLEVTVKVTGPDDFTTGGFQCPQPTDVAAIVEPVDGVAGAEQAWWKTSEAPPLEATLRACTADVLLEIDLDYEGDYEGDPRNDSVALATRLLAQLGA